MSIKKKKLAYNIRASHKYLLVGIFRNYDIWRPYNNSLTGFIIFNEVK